MALNGFGQAIVSYPPSLLTPTQARGTSLTSTSIPGLAGAAQTVLVALNETGTVVGYSCLGPQHYSCANHMFLWKPTSANSAAGTITEIPLPSGFVSTTPTGLNDNNDVVGVMVSSGGTTIPFLLTNNSIYDLTTASATLVGTTPAGINNAGQIVFNGGRVYLAGPVARPKAGGMSPSGGTGANQTFTFNFSSVLGYQEIRVADVLINTFLDGRKACYIAIVPSGPSSGAVYLVNDAGDAGGPYSAMTLPSGATIQNSQCTVSAIGSTISGSGNTLTVTLTIAFRNSFAGNKVAYLAVQDPSGNSGWQALGTWNIPGVTPTGPRVLGATPSRGTKSRDTYTFVFQGTSGFADLSVVNVLINDFIDGRRACYVAFVPSGSGGGGLFLVNDAGDANGPNAGMVLPGSASIQNSQCRITGSGSTVSTNGNVLTVTLNITFLDFSGNRIVYLAARSNSVSSDWQAVGSVAVP